jgi:phosphoenolpyruvate synthase/pyruvate phosphate dikinase
LSFQLPSDVAAVDSHDPNISGFRLTDEQVVDITTVLGQAETLFQQPTSIEWALVEGKVYLLQARPTINYIPLPPEMLTEPSERRVLYRDAGLTDGVTIKNP